MSANSISGKPPASRSRKTRSLVQGDRSATLHAASASNAYTLSDRGTWISFKTRGELDILVHGDQRLFNQYKVILVNPAKHPHVKKDLGQAFIDWLTTREGKNAIAGYRIEGQQPFVPYFYRSRA